MTNTVYAQSKLKCTTKCLLFINVIDSNDANEASKIISLCILDL